MLSPLTPACVLFHFSLWSIRASLHLVCISSGEPTAGPGPICGWPRVPRRLQLPGE